MITRSKLTLTIACAAAVALSAAAAQACPGGAKNQQALLESQMKGHGTHAPMQTPVGPVSKPAGS